MASLSAFSIALEKACAGYVFRVLMLPHAGTRKAEFISSQWWNVLQTSITTVAAIYMTLVRHKALDFHMAKFMVMCYNRPLIASCNEAYRNLALLSLL